MLERQTTKVIASNQASTPTMELKSETIANEESKTTGQHGAAPSRLSAPGLSQQDYSTFAGSLFESEAAADLISLSKHPARYDGGDKIDPMSSHLIRQGRNYTLLGSRYFAYEENDQRLFWSRRAAVEQSYQNMLAHHIAAATGHEKEIANAFQYSEGIAAAHGMDCFQGDRLGNEQRRLLAGHVMQGHGLAHYHTYFPDWQSCMGSSVAICHSPQLSRIAEPNLTPRGVHGVVPYERKRVLQKEQPRSTSSARHKSAASECPQSKKRTKEATKSCWPYANAECGEQTYHDASLKPDPTDNQLLELRARGSFMESFPVKLYRMLIEVDDCSLVAFFPHGRSFKIFDGHKFANCIIKKYFHQTRLESFKRQLNVYGFKRISEGPESGGYYHEYMLRGRPQLANLVRRDPKGKVTTTSRLPTIRNRYPPNFKAMPPICLDVVTSNGLTGGKGAPTIGELNSVSCNNTIPDKVSQC